MPEVAIVLGTYQRRSMLEECVASIRQAVADLAYRIIIVDGGSTDGSVAWMEQQPDVELIHGDLSGAVRNFNLGFARAVELEAAFVAIANDDDRLLCPPPIIAESVEIMRADQGVGGVAWETNLRGAWACETWNGRAYVNKGVIRREAGMAAARAAGDSEGKAWWSRDHHTYASDTELGLWIQRLGWDVVRGAGLRVDDNARNGSDAMRKRNGAEYARSGTVELFKARWADPARCEYSPEDAARFGGRAL